MRRKIISFITVAALLFTCVFGLTACNMSEADYVKAVKEVAKNYYTAHDDYEKFDDITIATKKIQNGSSPSSEVEGTVDKNDMTIETAYSVKIVDGDVLFVATRTKTTNSTYNYMDGEEKKVQTNEQIEEASIYLGVKKQDDAKLYYLVCESSNKEDGEVTFESKLFNLLDEEDYVDLVNDTLDNVNEKLIADVFFDFAMNVESREIVGDGLKIEKKGNDIITSVDYDSFLIMGGSFLDYNIKLSSTIKNGLVDSYNKEIINEGRNSGVTIVDVKVTHSSDATFISSLEGYSYVPAFTVDADDIVESIV